METDYACADCGVDTMKIGEYFMVHDQVWKQAVVRGRPRRTAMLCIGCLEGRIGRRLARADFSPLPINGPVGALFFGPKSIRLTDRLSA